jgi:hypothetical protein
LKSSILHAFKGPPTLSATNSEGQIRAELFSVERREQRAESLATAQRITTEPGTDRRLATRLRDNGRALLEESPRRDRAAGRRDSRGEYGRDVDSGAFNRVAIMRSLGSDYGPSMTILLAECVLVRAATGIDSGGEVHGLSRLQFGQSLSDQVFVSAPTLRVRRGDSHRPGGVGE